MSRTNFGSTLSLLWMTCCLPVVWSLSSAGLLSSTSSFQQSPSFFRVATLGRTSMTNPQQKVGRMKSSYYGRSFRMMASISSVEGSVGGDHFFDPEEELFTTYKKYGDIQDAVLVHEEDDGDSAMKKLHNICSILCAGMAGWLFMMPDRTLSVELASKMGGVAGFGIASALVWMLSTPHETLQLSPSTSKRLNFGLLVFALGGLVALPGEAGFPRRFTTSLITWTGLTVVRLVLACTAYFGWKQRIASDLPITQSIGLIKDDLLRGFGSVWESLRTRQRNQASTYQNLLVLLMVGMFSSSMDFFFNIRYQFSLGKTAFDISLKLLSVVRLGLISTLVYSLKEASDTGTLTEHSSIALNVLVGLWALLVGIGESTALFGFSLSRGLYMYIFSLPFILQAVKSIIERNERDFFT